MFRNLTEFLEKTRLQFLSSKELPIDNISKYIMFDKRKYKNKRTKEIYNTKPLPIKANTAFYRKGFKLQLIIQSNINPAGTEEVRLC